MDMNPNQTNNPPTVGVVSNNTVTITETKTESISLADQVVTPSISAELAKDENTIFNKEADNSTNEQIFREALEQAAGDDIEMKHLDQMGLSIPLSNAEKLIQHQKNEGLRQKDTLQEQLNDATSDIQATIEAARQYTKSREELLESLKHIKNIESLQPSFKGIGDNEADIFKKYSDKKEIHLEGDSGLLALTTITGGLRRVCLWNSGFTITLRALPIGALGQFYQEISHEDFQYGREFGMFYYLFSDISITEYIITNLLPLVICGSNYINWKDTKKLISAISYQDYPTILWAMGTMMYPSGIDVSFICSEPDCDYVHKQKVDLSKLRLLNTDIINDAMVEHFKRGSTWITDEMLVEYRKNSNLNSTIEFDYTANELHKKWKIYLKQPTIAEFVKVGNDFIGELRKKCRLSEAENVGLYTSYMFNRVYKPWIDKAELTLTKDGEDHTFIIDNSDDSNNDEAIYLILEEFQSEAPEFATKVRDYINTTKISHIAYYFPECPKCHKEPEMSYHGYLPYDPMQSFFTLTLIKLLRVQSNYEKKNT